MPRLLLFAPCERVIINTEDNNVTLMTVLSEIGVSWPSSAMDKLRDTPRLLTRWQVIASWLREPGDEGREFEQICELVMPDGSKAGEPARATFTMKFFAYDAWS